MAVTTWVRFPDTAEAEKRTYRVAVHEYEPDAEGRPAIGKLLGHITVPFMDWYGHIREGVGSDVLDAAFAREKEKGLNRIIGIVPLPKEE